MSRYVERITAGRSALWKDGSPQLPALDMELTERCNNRCIHCCINLPEDDASARAKELTASEIERILKEAAQLGCLQVRFTGGEPLLREDFEELYILTRRLGMKVLLFTNARLITVRLADLFRQMPPLMPIEISVYGMSEKSYEAVTQTPGSFVEFRRGIDMLLDRSVPFVVKTALLPPNRDELKEFATWAATLPWMDGPPDIAMLFDLRNRRDDEAKNERIRSLRPSPREVLSVLCRKPAEYRREMAEFCAKFAAPQGNRLFGCGAGRNGCVDAYGQWQPCIGLRAPEFLYDLHRGKLQDAMALFESRFRDLRALHPQYIAHCARCSIKNICEQCPAKSWSESGELDAPIDYLCQTAHAQARFLGLLKACENGWNVVKSNGK